MYRKPDQRIVESISPDFVHQTKEIVASHAIAISDLVAAVRNLEEYTERVYAHDEWLVDNLRQTFDGLFARIHELNASSE